MIDKNECENFIIEKIYVQIYFRWKEIETWPELTNSTKSQRWWCSRSINIFQTYSVDGSLRLIKNNKTNILSRLFIFPQHLNNMIFLLLKLKSSLTSLLLSFLSRTVSERWEMEIFEDENVFLIYFHLFRDYLNENAMFGSGR